MAEKVGMDVFDAGLLRSPLIRERMPAVPIGPLTPSHRASEVAA
jgi:hypothetical protein